MRLRLPPTPPAPAVPRPTAGGGKFGICEPGTRPPPRGVSGVLVPVLPTVTRPVPESGLPLAEVEVESPVVPGVFPDFEPVLVVDVFAVDVLLVPWVLVVFEPVLVVDVFEVEVVPVVFVVFDPELVPDVLKLEL